MLVEMRHGYMKMPVNLYKLSLNDAKRASEVLAKAFLQYPTFEYVFPDMEERKRKLAKVLQFLLKLGVYNGQVVAPSEKLEGISIWYKLNGSDVPFITVIKSGIIGLLFSIRRGSLIRLISSGSDKKRKRRQIMKNDYICLDMIGVNPECKKSGYGKLMICGMLEYYGSMNLPVYLETSNADNIVYYEKFGFQLIDEYIIGSLKSFCMVKT